MENKEYTVWPVGRLPKEWQRPELDQLKAAGYDWNDPRDAIDMFEKKVAKFAGSKYAVALDTCSHGLFLCMKYMKCKGKITIPKNTYVSPAMQIIHAGCEVEFEDFIGLVYTNLNHIIYTMEQLGGEKVCMLEMMPYKLFHSR